MLERLVDAAMLHTVSVKTVHLGERKKNVHNFLPRISESTTHETAKAWKRCRAAACAGISADLNTLLTSLASSNGVFRFIQET